MIFIIHKYPAPVSQYREDTAAEFASMLCKVGANTPRFTEELKAARLKALELAAPVRCRLVADDGDYQGANPVVTVDIIPPAR